MKILLISLMSLAALAQPQPKPQPKPATTDDRIATFEKALKASPKDARTQAGLAAAFIQKLRETTDFAYLNRAATLVDQMLAADPKNYDGLRLKTEIETHRHNFPVAAQLAAALVERNPSDAGAYGMLGDSLMELGKYDAAGEAYKEMLSLGANLASYNRVAYHRFVTGKGNEALSWMMMAVQAGSRTPENLAWCLVEFGDMLTKTGHLEDARAAYRQSLDTLPGYHRALAAQGRLLAAAGEFEKAAANFKRSQAVIPLPEYADALVSLDTKLGRATEAEQQRKMLDVIDRLGQANGEKGNRALAVAYADEARNPDRAVALAAAELETRQDVYAYDALSWALFHAGRQKDAAEASAKALALHTPEPMFLYHAGLIALAGGNAPRGNELLRSALALNPSFAFPQADDARQRVAQSKTVATRAGQANAAGQREGQEDAARQPVAQADDARQSVAQANEASQPVVQADEPRQREGQSDDASQPVVQADAARQPVAQADAARQPVAQANAARQPVAQADNARQPEAQADDARQPPPQAQSKTAAARAVIH